MKKKILHQVLANQHGSVINVALLILILIFLIGIGLSRMSTTDIKIASNIKQDTTTFYEADTGLENAGEMIEQNLQCSTGFTITGTKDDFDNLVGTNVNTAVLGGQFFVNNVRFAYNERKRGAYPGLDPKATVEIDPGDYVPEVDFYYPIDLDRTLTDEEYEDVPHTNISVGGASRYSTGSAIQMAAGYEGLGKGAAAGGSSIIFDVYAVRIGENNTASTHFMQWVHIIETPTGCSF